MRATRQLYGNENSPTTVWEWERHDNCMGMRATRQLYGNENSPTIIIIILVLHLRLSSKLPQRRMRLCSVLEKFSFKQFLNTEKVILGSFKLEKTQFKNCWTSIKESTRANCLGGGGWYKQVTGRRRISGVIDQGAKRPVCSIETDTGVHSRVDTCKRRYRVWTRPFLGRGASVVRRAWRPKRWPTWVGQGQGELRHGERIEADLAIWYWNSSVFEGLSLSRLLPTHSLISATQFDIRTTRLEQEDWGECS